MRAKPTTHLDPRFSDPGASATDWGETRLILENAELFWITTVRKNGQPHVTPLTAVWLDDCLHFCTGEAEQKAHNLARNPRVVLTTGCNLWQEGTDVIVEGDAAKVIDHDLLQRLAQTWVTKWAGRWVWEVREGGFQSEDGSRADVFRVRPSKVFAFAKQPFAHTTHNF